MQQSIFDIMFPKFKITKPIRLIELFSGYGSQALALIYLGVKFEHWKIVEWAIKSIQAYKDAHYTDIDIEFNKDRTKEEIVEQLFKLGVSSDYNNPLTKEQLNRYKLDDLITILKNIAITKNLVNICNVKGKDLEIVDTDKYDYIMTYSFPCFTKDSLVLTNNGYKKIINIKIGDKVLTHDNTYKRVINKFNNGTHDVYKINAMGVDEIKTTINHKFYVREMYRKGHIQKRYFKNSTWKMLKDITKKDYLGIPINTYSITPIYENLPTKSENFWWVIGRYIGDGWIRQQGGIIICCGKTELSEITCKLDGLFNYNVVEDRTTYKVHISKICLSNFVKQFGSGAKNKHLTNVIMNLPNILLNSFLDGYFSADGCKVGKNYKATSISKKLIYGIGMCVAKVYKTPYKIYKVEPSKKKVIEDRIVNQNIWYQLVFKKEKCKQDKAFYENNYIWYPIKEISYFGKENVYDIEVEKNHSFTVQNTIVHNCQDLSLAGKRAGMSDNSTRSGMLWEVERILDEIANNGGELPQILLMENVPQVIGTENVGNFNNWQRKLEKLGYKNYHQNLIATDYGIPQTRNRTFMISILGDYSYTFPKPIPLELKLKDMLENDVDEKYYLSDKMINYMTGKNAKESKYNRGEVFARNFDEKKEVAATITTNAGNRATDNFIIDNLTKDTENYIEWKEKGKLDVDCRAWKDEKVMSTIMTTPKNKVLENSDNLKTKLCNDLISKGIVQENDVVKHNYTGQIMSGDKKCIEMNNIMPTMTTRPDCLGVATKQDNNLRIRKLTPREAFRLMGVKDEDYERIAKNQSNSSLYHLAGDSIVVNILCEIFKQLLQ